MRDDQIPRGWRRINDVCIGVPNERGAGFLYTAFLANGKWECWRAGEFLSGAHDSMDAAVQACRNDYKTRRVAA